MASNYSEDTSSSSSKQHDCLSKLLGMKYDKLYLPLMFTFGLIREVHSNRHKTSAIILCVESIKNGFGYSWGDFIAEHNIDIELSYIYQVNDKKKRKMFFEYSFHQILFVVNCLLLPMIWKK